MPVKRDKDGNVIDIPTRVTRKMGDESGEHRTVDVVRPRRPMDSPTGPRRDAYDRATSATPPLGARGIGAGVPTKPMERPPGRRSDATVVHPRPAKGAMDDPPVGWLVVVAGPGMGSVAALGLGVNSVGREHGANRVVVDHGDDMISRTNHGAIVYDDRNRKFWIRHGDGTNLTYVDDDPVLEARILEPLTHIRMGRTVLRFVPLCGESFSWTDHEAKTG